MSRVSFLPFPFGRASKRAYGRLDEEFCADFYLVAKRSLVGLEWNVFRLHFAQGQKWRFCCERLKVDRVAFFQTVYRVEQRLGRIYRELQPYPLFPLDEYFGGVRRKEARDVDELAGLPAGSFAGQPQPLAMGGGVETAMAAGVAA